jgi:large subunit ribosomal protein L40e
MSKRKLEDGAEESVAKRTRRGTKSKAEADQKAEEKKKVDLFNGFLGRIRDEPGLRALPPVLIKIRALVRWEFKDDVKHHHDEDIELRRRTVEEKLTTADLRTAVASKFGLRGKDLKLYWQDSDGKDHYVSPERDGRVEQYNHGLLINKTYGEVEISETGLLKPGTTVYFSENDRMYPIGQLFVKGLLGETDTYDVEDSMTVEAFKDLLIQKKGYQKCQMRLIYAGRQLEDGRTLLDYGLTRVATIHLVYRLSGS